VSKDDLRRWQGWDDQAAEGAPVVERCSYCAFTASGPVEETRQAFAEHVCDRPKPTTTHRTSGFVLRR
jgi:hypothetical protein